MRKILFLSLFFVSVLGFKCEGSEDNILALDVGYGKEEAPASLEKGIQKSGDTGKTDRPAAEALPDEASDKELERMRAYRETIENKKNELEVIRLDLEKSNTLLKKKEAEKEIYQIDNALQGRAKNGSSGEGGPFHDGKEHGLDPSDIKIKLLVISDNLKEGQIVLKGISYSFQEGDVLPFKLTVEKIESRGVTLRESSGAVLKLNFIN